MAITLYGKLTAKCKTCDYPFGEEDIVVRAKEDGKLNVEFYCKWCEAEVEVEIEVPAITGVSA